MCSSSESWAGGARAAGDIIDLDRFMRSARPSPPAALRASPQRQLARNGLVVDNGSLSRKASRPSSSGSSERAVAPAPATHARDKRFSHDSGLSDGSYVRRRHRPHRRVSGSENANRNREPQTQAVASTSSLRAFRTACSRALREQQQAITRVAQLCERLAERRQTTPATSEITSSSLSTRDQRRKDKHRTDECKTYKIIMTKLDELNRLFNARARSPPAPARPQRAPILSASVSVADKLVATEPETRKTVAPVSQITTKRLEAKWKPSPSPSHLVERAVGSESVRSGALGERSRRSARLAALRAVPNAHALDIPPHDAVPNKTRETPNIITESVVKHESSIEDSGSSVCDPHCGFDLDNPVHLYAQAKRLQALHATTHRRAQSGERACGARHGSLCGACRGYWRSLRHYLAAQIFCCPQEACCS